MNKRRYKKRIEYILYEDPIWGFTAAVGFLIASSKNSEVCLVSNLVDFNPSESGNITLRIPKSQILARTTIKKF